jgi:hypothetical protein
MILVWFSFFTSIFQPFLIRFYAVFFSWNNDLQRLFFKCPIQNFRDGKFFKDGWKHEAKVFLLGLISSTFRDVFCTVSDKTTKNLEISVHDVYRNSIIYILNVHNRLKNYYDILSLDVNGDEDRMGVKRRQMRNNHRLK